MVIGARSLSRSYGRLSETAGLIESGPDWTSSSV